MSAIFLLSVCLTYWPRKYTTRVDPTSIIPTKFKAPTPIHSFVMSDNVSHWLPLKMRTLPLRMRRITWPINRGQNNYIFGIPDPDLPIHYTTFIGLRRRLKVVYSRASLPSELWRCWLGRRKGIRPVKNWAVGCWRGYLSGARCRLAYGPSDATATHCLLLH